MEPAAELCTGCHQAQGCAMTYGVGQHGPWKGTLIGQRFARLLVIAKGPNNKYGQRRWICKCDCGGESLSTTGSLRSGTAKSCGCWHKEQASKANATHRMFQTATHQSWHAMHTRCRNVKQDSWKYYGARGVTICERWYSFENFLADMGERPNGLSLDRIDPYGNYEPSNCRWATASEQSRNTRRAKEKARERLDFE